MSYVTMLKGKPQLDKGKAFCQLLENTLPSGSCPAGNQNFNNLFKSFDVAIKANYPNISRGALNNAHGDWYEWLLAIAAWNYHARHHESYLALILPNVSRFDVVTLYTNELYELIVDLRRKLEASALVRLVTSNPDFVLIDPTHLDVPPLFKQEINMIDLDTISQLENVYKYFIGKCRFDDLVGYLSVKTSLRPDRRLQISHEGNLMKAIYTHLQTRQWIIQPQGLKYYAISAKVGDADRKALKTVATHSITTVHSMPQATVDEVFTINSLAEAEEVYNTILMPDKIEP